MMSLIFKNAIRLILYMYYTCNTDLNIRAKLWNDETWPSKGHCQISLHFYGDLYITIVTTFTYVTSISKHWSHHSLLPFPSCCCKTETTQNLQRRQRHLILIGKGNNRKRLMHKGCCLHKCHPKGNIIVNCCWDLSPQTVNV